MTKEPIQLRVRKIMEYGNGAELISCDVRHWLHLRHITVNKLHGNSSLAYRRGNALDGTVTYVTDHKDARHAGLQQKGIAIKIPPRRTLTVFQQVWPCQNKSSFITNNGPLEPIRPR